MASTLVFPPLFYSGNYLQGFCNGFYFVSLTRKFYLVKRNIHFQCNNLSSDSLKKVSKNSAAQVDVLCKPVPPQKWKFSKECRPLQRFYFFWVYIFSQRIHREHLRVGKKSNCRLGANAAQTKLWLAEWERVYFVSLDFIENVSLFTLVL